MSVLEHKDCLSVLPLIPATLRSLLLLVLVVVVVVLIFFLVVFFDKKKSTSPKRLSTSTYYVQKKEERKPSPIIDSQAFIGPSLLADSYKQAKLAFDYSY